MAIAAACRRTDLTKALRDRVTTSMKLLVVRHAIALDRDTPGIEDSLRPLTEEGVTKFKKTAKSLSTVVTADVVLSSPYLRAKQTAEILARHWTAVTVQESDPLAEGSRPALEEALARMPGSATVALVGHEPHLSNWTAAWLGATNPDAFAYKKGGAALIEFDGGVAREAGRLIWFLPPRIFREVN